jgi:hypothetical protein
MNANRIGEYIEEQVKARYGLVDSELGFDGWACGKEYEIKGCIPTHKNGVTQYGKDRVTKGRFWIDNSAHRLLLDVNGMYIFVLYTWSGEKVITLRTRFMPAREVQKIIKPGDNTKIRYDILFVNYRQERV